MLILALDASTPVVAVAVARADGAAREVLAEISVSSSRTSEVLLAAVDAALSLAGEELASVERVLAGVGPGTFTGIRIAATTARALALATPGFATLSKNSTLAALAAPALSGGQLDVLAAIDARRGQVFAQRFSEAGPASGISCVTPDGLAVADHPLIVGDGAVRYRDVLSPLGSIPPDSSPLHRVTAAGHVLSADLSPVKASELVPVYVREPDAEIRRGLNPWGRP